MNSDDSAPSTARTRRLSYALVMTPLLIGNAVMLALCLLGFHVLSATRAYVGGESQWSKARAQAFRHLRAYADGGTPGQLQRFEAALAVPLGDRTARLALDAPEPDLALATEGFLRGGNAADDIPGMIRLYRWFGGTELMSASVQAWRHGDQLIARLQDLAQQLQGQLERPEDERGPQLLVMLALLDELENELLGLERRFSQALGEASRTTFRLLEVVVALTALLLTLTAWLLVRAGLRRQARDEAALEDANRRWSLAAESDGLGVFEWHQADERVLLDARACAVYGLPCGPQGLEIPRSRVRALVLDEDVPPLQLQLDQATESGLLFRQRFRIRPETGAAEPRHIVVTGVMQGSLAAGDRRMVGVIKDVSQQVRQETLALEKAAAERSAAARMEFLSRLSHELRTPLNAVLGFSDLLLMNGAEPLSERQRRSIQMIGGAGKHLLRLVDDVLDISGIDSGQFSVARVPTPLAPVLAEAAALVSAEAREFQVTLEQAALPQEGLAVLGDAQRLGQVLANLLSNACKYNRPGGRVGLRVLARAQGRLAIEIEDQGPGLSEAEQAQLFQPFKRLPATAHLRGTGLGLTIVKLLVEQMGGTIELRSTPGQGSVFSVLLQRAEGENAAALPRQAAAA